jgi:hypothetical protein
MLVDDIVIEYDGQAYKVPVLLVGSARSKISQPDLADRLEEAMDGREAVVVIEAEQAQGFYAAARTISVQLERETVDWQRLLAELQAKCSEEPASSRSRILRELSERFEGRGSSGR